MYLESIISPAQIKEFSYDQLAILAEEIRKEIIQTVSQNGGHLASNLGVVEITLALHRVFDAPKDKIIFDVGHQSYVHKLITGRYKQFHTIRMQDGLSGFPKRDESEYDCFETGHASTSISAALGLARARDFKGRNEQVVALIGDGALGGGMCYEALNDAGSSQTPMIVIVNDNDMSISKNVGAMANYLTHLRVSKGWIEAKKAVKFGLNKLPVIGKPIYRFMDWLKDLLKGMVIDEGFFEALGFVYLGPIDGHDIETLEYVFNNAKTIQKPVIIHCITKKGNGYKIAESAPDLFHGASPFSVDSGEALEMKNGKTCGEVAGSVLTQLAEEDDKIVAVTAAMPIGTGMTVFKNRFPDRVLDVGIAESHAVTMAAGMAAGGMHPYVAIYSTFLQRGYDQLFHDVALQNLSVCFLLDRAGIAGADGSTHHGLYDFAYLRTMPHFAIMAPKDLQELDEMINYSQKHVGPCAIRYPRSLPEKVNSIIEETFVFGKWNILVQGTDCVILAVGAMVGEGLKTAKLLKEKYQVSSMVVNASTVKPLDEEFLLKHSHLPIITMEEHVLEGGFSSSVDECCVKKELPPPVLSFAITSLVSHGDRNILLKKEGLTADLMAEKAAAHIMKRKAV